MVQKITKQELLNYTSLLINEPENFKATRVPKKGIFSFGRKNTVVTYADETKQLKISIFSTFLKIASFVNSYKLDPIKREERIQLANAAQNLNEIEKKLIETQKKPTSTQKARIKSNDKIYKKGAADLNIRRLQNLGNELKTLNEILEIINKI